MSTISSISSSKKCRRSLQNFKTSKIKFKYIDGEFRSICDCEEILPESVRTQNGIKGNVYHDMCQKMIQYGKIQLQNQIPNPNFPEGYTTEIEFVTNQTCDIKTQDNSPPIINNLNSSFSQPQIKTITPEWVGLEEGIVLVSTGMSDSRAFGSNLRIQTITNGNNGNDGLICEKMDYLLHFYALIYNKVDKRWEKLGAYGDSFRNPFGSLFDYPSMNGYIVLKIKGGGAGFKVLPPSPIGPVRGNFGIGTTGAEGPTYCSYNYIDRIDEVQVDSEKSSLTINPQWAERPCGVPCQYSFPKNIKITIDNSILLPSERMIIRRF